MNTNETRHSHAGEAELITDQDELAKLEGLNGIRQFDAVVGMVETFLSPDRPFKFRPSHLLHLHREALRGITRYAGTWRPADIEIGGSKHRPIGAHQVPEMIEDMCDYVNSFWQEKTAIHLSAYVMWRLNWIHPFTDGNGRTSRAASYLVLCVKIGYLLPGKLTIPDQISQEKTPYYQALEAADQSLASAGAVDLGQMEALLSSLLARQLLQVMNDAGSKTAHSIA